MKNHHFVCPTHISICGYILLEFEPTVGGEVMTASVISDGIDFVLAKFASHC